MQQATVSHFMSAPLRKPRSAPTLRLHQLMEEQQRIEIGRRIHKLREAGPQTNRSIADHVGVGERAVANWMSGTTGIEYDNCKKVAHLFEVDVQWLWSGVGKATATPDLMGALGGGGRSQLARIEAKLDAIMAALDVALPQTGDGPTFERELEEHDEQDEPRSDGIVEAGHDHEQEGSGS